MSYTHTDSNLPIEDKYPKLVRDKIPELIERQGKKASTRVLMDDDEYLLYLLTKLIEEATELANAQVDNHQLEELADVFEVLSSIMQLRKLTLDDVRLVQDEKRQQRGGFSNRILMLCKP